MTLRNTFWRFCFALMILFAPTAHAADIPDWWEYEMLVAKGYGFVPANAENVYSGRSLARRAAIVDGYRNLAEQVKEIHVTAETTVEKLIVSGDIVKTKVDAVIRGAKIVSEEYGEDGSCVVVMAVPIYGVANSIADLTFKPADKEAFPTPPADLQTQGNYTGLIIDCGDSDLKPVLTPVIRNAENISIYSRNNLDYDKLVRGGMVGYVKKDDKDDDKIWLVNFKGKTLLSYTAQIENKLLLVTAQSTTGNAYRAGDNPLIIKATRLSDDDSCPVVSKSDADRILAENEASHFLDNGAVVFTSYRVGGLRV